MFRSLARALRSGREELSAGASSAVRPALRCQVCGMTMNEHAEKVDCAAAGAMLGAVDPVFHGLVQEVHQCAACGNIQRRGEG
jgi:hypothetical protein